MEYLLIPLACALASLKVTLQSKFSKKGSHTLAQSVLFTAVMFATISVMFLPTLFDGGVTGTTVLYAAALGIFSYLYQVFYVLALSRGRMTLTVLINNFGMLIPMAVSIFMLGDPFTPLIGVGVVLVFASLCLSVTQKKEARRSGGGEGAKWLILALIVFLTNGIASAAQKLYTAKAGADIQLFEFVCISYLFAAAASFITYLFLSPADKKNGIKPITKGEAFIGCGVGAALGVFQCVNTVAMSLIGGSVYYPANNCLTSLMLALIGALLFKERFTVKQYVGIVLGIVAVVILCI